MAKAFPHFNDLLDYKSQNIIYCGFVNDIDLYFKGCDIFLNPLQDGGGIKTKLVEALGFGKTCISSENGAIGVLATQTQGRLHIVPDTDWKVYSKKFVPSQVQCRMKIAIFMKHFRGNKFPKRRFRFWRNRNYQESTLRFTTKINSLSNGK